MLIQETRARSVHLPTAVDYEDFGDPFTVYRCDNANMTMDTIVDRLGRVPVGLRRFVATVVIF
ncbi:hypothetical protein C8R44DRAFT_805204 [Mycena epipterygia]|nr:hypothetical protein C8R44DRAFT_805204 [Mycena epipterygia]